MEIVVTSKSSAHEVLRQIQNKLPGHWGHELIRKLRKPEENVWGIIGIILKKKKVTEELTS